MHRLKSLFFTPVPTLDVVVNYALDIVALAALLSLFKFHILVVFTRITEVS